jgi:hypothetical protein
VAGLGGLHHDRLGDRDVLPELAGRHLVFVEADRIDLLGGRVEAAGLLHPLEVVPLAPANQVAGVVADDGEQPEDRALPRQFRDVLLLDHPQRVLRGHDEVLRGGDHWRSSVGRAARGRRRTSGLGVR